METYACAECDNDHYKLWSDFATMIWIHKNSYFLQRIKSGVTIKARVKKVNEKVVMLEKEYTSNTKSMRYTV